MKIFSYAFLSLFAAVLCFSSSGSAEQPLSIGWQVITPRKVAGGFNPSAARPQGDHSVRVQLFAANPDLVKQTLLVDFGGCSRGPTAGGHPISNLDEFIANPDRVIPQRIKSWEEPGPLWQVCPSRSQVLIAPGRRVNLDLLVSFFGAVDERISPRIPAKVYLVDTTDLKQSRRLDLRKAPKGAARAALRSSIISDVVGEQALLGEAEIDLYYLLSSSARFQYASFVELYGAGERDPIDVSRRTFDYLEQQSSLPVNTEAYRRTLPLPTLTEWDRGEMLKQAYSQALEGGSGLPNETQCFSDDEFGGKESILRVAAQTNASHTIRGRWSTRWTTDNTLHPGWGFMVEAWTDEGGPWRRLGWTWVQSNGSWVLPISVEQGFEGSKLRILYRSYNSYYRPQDQDNNTYSWAESDRFNIPTNLDVGHRVPVVEVNGLGELVDAAMTMWSRLFHRAGISPLGPQAVNVFYPNTWNNCGGSSPWSCASFSGENIWLIPTHGVRAFVVTHELGHHLNFIYWDNVPANSGGSHALNTCYPTRLGMTLTEGFASYVAGWVGYQNRRVAEGGFAGGRWDLSGIDLETRNAPPNCASGWTNEIWTGRVFWDLHDFRVDGDDILHFNHPGAVMSIYLSNQPSSNGAAWDMRDYENIYRNAASSGHQDFVSAIFENNRH